ncbi:autotransporter outer membrane beta-barrel domain-containing protein, partial [Campylobacter jejuni]
MTLTIESSGTLQPNNGNNAFKLGGQNSNNATLTLINQGTIKGKIGIENGGSNFNGTITVKTFENKKTIDGHIYMGIWQGNGGTISIETFNNEGTITTSNNNDGVIYFEGTTHITTFHNKGTIESKNGKNSISLKAQNNQTPTLENFINEGFIKGDIGVRNNGSNFTGTITVKTFENKGTIGGQVNMGIFDGKSGTINIDTFKNSGTITGTGDYGRGVFFMDIHSAIKTFENTGTISGDGYNCMDGGL